MDKLPEIELVHDWLINAGLSNTAALYLNMATLLLIGIVIAYIVEIFTKKVLLNVFHKFAERTATKFDDFLIANKAITNLSYIVPYTVFSILIPYIFIDFPNWLPRIRVAIDLLLVILVLRTVRSFLFALRDYLKTTDNFKDKPVESFIQLIMIFMYITAGLIMFSLLTGKSVLAFLTAMGAASAVLLLVFRDTILGFVASIQVSINDMVRIGDWISMEKYGADGDVIEINLATVKVQNWDKTITTIPTYYLISDSFKNWRGMQVAGGRRIKRALHIKISSIKHLSEDEVTQLKKIQLVAAYLDKRSEEINEYNTSKKVDKELLINGRHLTNIGVFREYIDAFIKNHPDIHKDMTMMVRQLEPTTTGMAIELYAFSNKTDWVVYENIMSDIFDHLLASVKFFWLETYEMPASDDIRYLKN